MAGSLCIRTVLPPPRHATENEARIPLETHVGTDTKPLHHARSEPLDEAVGLGDQVEQRRHAIGMLQIEGDVAPPAEHEVRMRTLCVGAHRSGTIDADHVCAEIGEQHRGERARPDACEFDDPVSGERSCHGHSRFVGVDIGRDRRRATRRSV